MSSDLHATVNRLRRDALVQIGMWEYFYRRAYEETDQDDSQTDVAACAADMGVMCAQSSGRESKDALALYASVSRKPFHNGLVDGTSATEFVFALTNRLMRLLLETVDIDLLSVLPDEATFAKLRSTLPHMLGTLKRMNDALLSPELCRELEAEVKWEASRVLGASGTSHSVQGHPESLLQRARNWLYARFVENFQEHDIVAVYPSDGPKREPTETERHFAAIQAHSFHSFLDSIGADVSTIISECEKHGWIRFVKGGFNPKHMQAFYHILPVIQNPWPVDDSQTPTDEPSLSDRQYDILDTLYELKAFDAATKQTTDTVAARLGVDAAALKEPVSELGKQNFLKSKKGRGGGVWLSAEGKTQVEQQRKR